MTVTSLTVHRNTRDRREKHRVRNLFKQDAKSFLGNNIAGFAIIAWDQDSSAECSWHSGETMPGNVMPEFVKKTLERAIAIKDVKDIVHGPSDEDAS